MPNTLKEHGLGFPRGKLFDSVQETDAWDRQLCWTKDVAQDQKVFEIIEEGRVRTYGGLLRDTDEDAQSDAGSKIRRGQHYDAALRDVLQACLSQFASARGIRKESPGTEPSFVEEPQPCEAERGEQPGIIDETAEEWTSDRLGAELLELDAENNWARLSELTLAAEDFDFTSEQSALLAPRLLGLAIEHRDSNDPQDAPVVFSAIRTGASMLRPNEAGRLFELLEPNHPIDTSIGALKMVGRIFEAQPPEALDQHTDLAGKVRGIAELLLNRYAIASSQSAAMAQLAVYALAAMASSEVLNTIRVVRELGVSWFTHQTARELCELRNSWGTRSVPVTPAVLDLLDRATRES